MSPIEIAIEIEKSVFEEFVVDHGFRYRPYARQHGLRIQKRFSNARSVWVGMTFDAIDLTTSASIGASIGLVNPVVGRLMYLDRSDSRKGLPCLAGNPFDIAPHTRRRPVLLSGQINITRRSDVQSCAGIFREGFTASMERMLAMDANPRQVVDAMKCSKLARAFAWSIEQRLRIAVAYAIIAGDGTARVEQLFQTYEDKFSWSRKHGLFSRLFRRSIHEPERQRLANYRTLVMQELANKI